MTKRVLFLAYFFSSSFVVAGLYIYIRRDRVCLAKKDTYSVYSQQMCIAMCIYINDIHEQTQKLLKRILHCDGKPFIWQFNDISIRIFYHYFASMDTYTWNFIQFYFVFFFVHSLCSCYFIGRYMDMGILNRL